MPAGKKRKRFVINELKSTLAGSIPRLESNYALRTADEW